MIDYFDVQRALKARGHFLGTSGKNKDGVDGVPGRLTQAAVKAEQLKAKAAGDKRFTGSGIVGPATLEILGIAKKDDDGKIRPPALSTPWMAIAYSKVGKHEVRDNAELKSFLKSDGRTLGDPSVHAWCGDFTETCVAIALPEEPIQPTTRGNPYWAKNWTGFGIELAEPSPGAVLVFNRPGGGGHVGFYVGEEGSNFIVLGGNQSNEVSIMKIAKSRLEPKGIRWPKTYDKPTSGPLKLSLEAALSQNEA